MRVLSSAVVSAASLLPGLVSAIIFDCAHIKKDNYKYDLSPLGGVHELYHAEKVGDGTVLNTTYVLDVCNILGSAAIRGELNYGRSRNSMDQPGARKK